MMPANAHRFFKIIIQIATFDLFPTNFIIDEMEESIGISNDEFTLTDSFADFDFDSSGPIRNL